MSRIIKAWTAEKLGGDEMPWGNMIIEGKKFLICCGHTGRSPDKKQEYPEASERDDFTAADQAAMVTCPHTMEEQAILCLEKIKASLQAGGTSFENVFWVDTVVTRRSDRLRASRAMRKWMEKECSEFYKIPRPGFLRVAGLDHPDMLIEISMWACIPE